MSAPTLISEWLKYANACYGGQKVNPVQISETQQALDQARQSGADLMSKKGDRA